MIDDSHLAYHFGIHTSNLSSMGSIYLSKYKLSNDGLNSDLLSTKVSIVYNIMIIAILEVVPLRASLAGRNLCMYFRTIFLSKASKAGVLP